MSNSTLHPADAFARDHFAGQTAFITGAAGGMGLETSRAFARHGATVLLTNHSEFESPDTVREIISGASDDCLLVDPWNALGTAQVFGYMAEAAAMLGAAGEAA